MNTYVLIYIYIYICLHASMYTYIYIYIYIYISNYIYISADLFQSSSVLAYSCNPRGLSMQHLQSLPILTHLQASKHPSLHTCRDP